MKTKTLWFAAVFAAWALVLAGCNKVENVPVEENLDSTVEQEVLDTTEEDVVIAVELSAQKAGHGAKDKTMHAVVAQSIFFSIEASNFIF